MTYTCQNCGATAKKTSKLCNPIEEEASSKFCGTSSEQVCKGQMKTMKYSCESCGSLSADSEHLCNPVEIR